MPRYIDADAIHYVEIGKGVEIALASDIDKIPTVSLDDVRGAGKWIERADDWYGDYAECSNCHDEYTIPDGGLCFKFCPNCGARMGGVQDALS